MNIATETKNESGMRFRTILIITGVVLSLLFEVVYVGISIHNINRNAKTVTEEMLVEHNRLCESFAECIYQVERIENFIYRNNLVNYVKSNLNLVDANILDTIQKDVEEAVPYLSASGSIVDDFIIVGQNKNQKNLYVQLKDRTVIDENFPTNDILGETGMDGILLTNWGNIGRVEEKRLTEVLNDIGDLEPEEIEAVRNMVAFLKEQYFTCSYIDNTLIIIRLNKEYMEDKFKMEDGQSFLVYQSMQKPVLNFGLEQIDEEILREDVAQEEEFCEDEDYYYRYTCYLNGNLNAVTVRKKDNGNGLEYRLVIAALLLASAVSFLLLYMISGRIYERLNSFYQEIKRQSQLHDFSLMEIENDTKQFGKVSISNRIVIALLLSCVASLLVTCTIFNYVANQDIKNQVEAFLESVNRRYQNQYEIYYNRYESLSTVGAEMLIDEYVGKVGEDYQSNFELIKKFEESFYYDTSFLPGYSYAFIINQNKEVLYQTVLSSQTHISNNLVTTALSRADYGDNNSSFVSVNDFFSGEQSLAFVKKIYLKNQFVGNMIIVLDAPVLQENYMDGMLRMNYFVLNNRDEILISDLDFWEGANIGEIKEGISRINNRMIFVNNGQSHYLGRCGVAVDYDFYSKQVKEYQSYSLIIMLIMTLICFVVSYALRLLLIRPLNRLINHMYSMPDGFEQLISVAKGPDEISKIATVYNRMIIRLEELVEISIKQATRQQELELLQTQTEFKMLEQQINPHFLFNTLEVINLIAINHHEEQISKMVHNLSHIMHYAISKSTMVKVKKEIEALEAYVDIQRFRFGTSFTIEMDLDESLFDCYIIKFIVQPLLENAISHGMKQTTSGGKILVTLSCYEEGLKFQVADNGVGMSEDELEKLRCYVYGADTEFAESREGGIGLKNVYKRIKLYYNNQGDVLIDSKQNEGTTVTLHIPFAL